MSFLDRMAMKPAFKRLITAGVANSAETPITYDTAASPSQTQGQMLVLVTDLAMYFGKMGAVGAIRVPLSDLKQLRIDEQFGGVTYEYVYGISNSVMTFTPAGNGLKPFKEHMRLLAEQLQ